jgi:hypothetical protein
LRAAGLFCRALEPIACSAAIRGDRRLRAVVREHQRRAVGRGAAVVRPRTERGFRTGAIDALATARVFALCDAQALPGARLAADEVVLSLAACGRPAAASGPRRSVGVASSDARRARARCALDPRAFREA